MNLDALRSLQSKLSIVFVAAAALLLGSCGGGGAAVSPLTSGSLALLPASGSLYAGVPYTFTVAGGRKPYLVVSNEQTILPVNMTLEGNEFTVVPFNPGVVDPQSDPSVVPSRTVIVTVRDSANEQITATFNVLQNFFTGYSVGYSSTCATGTGTTPPQACSGQDTVATLRPTTQGALYGNKALQLDKVRGDFQFVIEDQTATPQLVNQLRTSTDQQGRAIVRMRVSVGAVTQLATYKVTDLKSGATTDQVFLIVQQQPSGTITLLPTTVSFTGALSTQCGSGTAQILVFDGAPPYSVISQSPIQVSPQTVASNGGTFNVFVPIGLTACPTQQVVVTDSQGRRASLDVKSSPGTGTPPPIVVSPAFTPSLTCTANTATVAVIGGIGPLSTVSNHPRVTAIISGNTLTVTRAPSGDGATIYPANATIVITDGATLTSLAVPGVSPNCP